MKTKLSIFFAVIAAISFSCSNKLTSQIEFDGGKLEINEMDFEYFQGKTRIHFVDEKNEFDAKATIRIRRDSIIWMTFSSAGITGGKCLINHDSITIVNTIKKEYYTFTYPELSERFNFTVDYETVEAAALGNLIMNRKDSDMAAETDTFMVLKQSSGPVSVENYIHRETHKIHRVDMKELPTKNTASINYTDFQAINDQYFPFSGLISLFYSTANATFNTTLEFKYSKAEILDKPIRFPFKIPKKYVGR